MASPSEVPCNSEVSGMLPHAPGKVKRPRRGLGHVLPSATAILLLALWVGPVLAETPQEEKEEEEEELLHKETPAFLYVGMVVTVIVLASVFERGQEMLVERFKEQDPKIRDMLLKMMICVSRELMILGFIGLLVFAFVKSDGALLLEGLIYPEVDTILLKEEGPLAESFETVHMFIFAVMLCYIFQSGVLGFQGFFESVTWRSWECLRIVSNKENEPTLYGFMKEAGFFTEEDGQLKKLKEVKIGKNPLKRIFNKHSVTGILQWRALRHEFMFPSYCLEEEEDEARVQTIPSSFDETVHRLRKDDVQFFTFYEYLTTKIADTFAELIEINATTWFLSGIACFLLPFIARAGPKWYTTIACVAAWGLVFVTYIIGVQVYKIYYEVTPKLPSDPVLCLYLFRGTSPSALKRNRQMEMLKKEAHRVEEQQGRETGALKRATNVIGIGRYWKQIASSGQKKDNGNSGDTKEDIKKPGGWKAVERSIHGKGNGFPSAATQPLLSTEPAVTPGIVSNAGKEIDKRIFDVKSSFASVRQQLEDLQARLNVWESSGFDSDFDEDSGDELEVERQDSIFATLYAKDTRQERRGSVPVAKSQETPHEYPRRMSAPVTTKQVTPKGQVSPRSMCPFRERLRNYSSGDQMLLHEDSQNLKNKLKEIKAARPDKKLEAYVERVYPDQRGPGGKEERLLDDYMKRLKEDEDNRKMVELCIRYKAIEGCDIPPYRSQQVTRGHLVNRDGKFGKLLKFLSTYIVKTELKRMPTPQDLLFQLHELGPPCIQMCFDTVIFFQAVVLAAHIQILLTTSGDWSWVDWLTFAFGILGPTLNIGWLVPRVAAKMVIIRSIEYMKDAQCCDEVIEDAKKARLLESLHLIQLAKMQGKLAKLGGETGKIGLDHFNEYRERFDTQFNKKRQDQLLQTFLLFDEDRSGTISKEEMGHVLSALGYDESSKIKAHAGQILKLVDVDNSGDIGEDEFKVLMAIALLKDDPEQEREDCEALFDKFDVGDEASGFSDGFVSIDELAVAFAKLGAPIDEDSIAELVRQVFNTYKQKLNRDEFVEFMTRLEEKLERSK